jgi:hypothetical protein
MSEKKTPEKKARSNRVSVSLWKNQVTAKTGEELVQRRACIQHSRKRMDNGEWVNQQIWMNVDELRDLAIVLDELNIDTSDQSEPADEEGDSSPSSGSMKVNHIMGYIKANSLDADMDVYDVDEMSSAEMLSKYGIHAKLNHVEEQMVRSELREYVENKEFSESAYMAQMYTPLADIPEQLEKIGLRNNRALA